MNLSHTQFCDDLAFDGELSPSNETVPTGPAVFVDCHELAGHPAGSLESGDSGSVAPIAHRIRTRKLSSKTNRKGATTVEMAVVLPVFLLFIFGIIQYGHLMWVNNMLRNAVREAARYGSTEGITSEEVIADVKKQMRGIVDVSQLNVTVKDASAFDANNEEPISRDDLEGFDEIELFTSQPRQLFVVQATISVDHVALVQLPAVGGFQLVGQTFMRHE